jgi:hypothetical protein
MDVDSDNELLTQAAAGGTLERYLVPQSRLCEVRTTVTAC